MIKVSKVYFPAFTGRESRKLYVYLPRQYEEHRHRRFPVLYMFDGHNVFYDSDATYGKSWGLGEYLDRHKVPLIVVALECHHGPNGERIQEYSPYDFQMTGEWRGLPEGESIPVEGYGRDTLDWFTEVLKPRIDKHYRTLGDRENTYLMGSSMGGLMSLYAIMEYSHVFSKACALSPAFEEWNDVVLENAEHADPNPESSLYMDYGCLEGDYPEAAESMMQVADSLLGKGMDVTMRFIPNGRHCEANWEKQLPFAISFLMYRKAEE